MRLPRSPWSWITGLVLLTAPLAVAEQVEIVTYYPSPSATTDDLRVKRATVGSGYKALNLDDPLAPIADGTLLVEGSVGIGTTTLAGLAPNGKLGNLTANDIFLTSTNAWASTLGGGAPVPPYTTYLIATPSVSYSSNQGGTVYSTSSVVIAHDVYEALGLAHFGVPRSQVRLVAWQPYAAFGRPIDKTISYGTNGYGQTVPNSYNVTPPVVSNGVIVVDPTMSGSSGPASVYEVTVTW